jgi:hypothetical protein
MTISVSLDPAQWAVVMQALGEAPWRLADPIIREVRARLEAAAQPQPALPVARDLANTVPPTAFEKLKDQLR